MKLLLTRKESNMPLSTARLKTLGAKVRGSITIALVTVALSTTAPCVATAADAVAEAVKALQSVGTEGSGFQNAIPAAQQLQQLPSTEIARVLDAAEGANPISENWIRGVVFGIAKNSGPPSSELLQRYVRDPSRNPIGRGLAMELIRQQSPELAKSMIDEYLNDPSLALREMAVEQAIEAAELSAKSDPDSAIARYRATLDAARHPKQLSRIVEALDKLGDPVTTAEAFALITQWNAIAPFDNVGGVGFDTAYPPETSFEASGKIDLQAELDGKNGQVNWRSVEGSGDEGVVDLAAAFNKEKGAVAYLYAEFESPMDQPAEVRLGCINANKVWINGQEVMANEVYHSGSMIDQYIAPVELRRGTNRILLKICQNEQEQSWAQEWEFQFRLTDPTGKGLNSSTSQ